MTSHPVFEPILSIYFNPVINGFSVKIIFFNPKSFFGDRGSAPVTPPF
jgi:hypothetical protein